MYKYMARERQGGQQRRDPAKMQQGGADFRGKGEEVWSHMT